MPQDASGCPRDAAHHCSGAASAATSFTLASFLKLRTKSPSARNSPTAWRRLNRAASAPHRLLKRVFRSDRAHRRRSLCALVLATACAVALVVRLALNGPFRPRGLGNTEGKSRRAAEVFGTSYSGPTSVLVQHGYAVQRMRLRAPERVPSVELPSWTLRVVPAECGDCLDVDSHGAALRQATADLAELGMEGGGAWGGSYAVFANAKAPLGRIGPMLLAMRSVTDDVDVAAELPQWGWLRHVQTSAASAAEAPAPYLAVLAIPTATSLYSEGLRRAQRETWLRYSAVARAENGFRGRLLPLYVFSAPEPGVLTPAAPGANVTALVEAALQPTTAEFAGATAYAQALGAAGAAGAGGVSAGVSYTQRRVTLRADWRTGDRLQSPCGEFVSATVRGGGAVPSLASVAAQLRVPVVPAMTSAAQYVCGSPASVWEEALVHGNAVWLDMMADYAPTSKKVHGDTMKWGAGTEFGMGQKSLAWLYYAYHAFPTVPFIIKCDDDTYVKVPQLVSDFGYMLAGRKRRTRLGGAVKDAGVPQELAVQAARYAQRECVYWGLLWGQYEDTPYFVGMHYTLSRQTARVVLEPPRCAYRTSGLPDALGVYLEGYQPEREAAYREAVMLAEDMLIGRLLMDRRRRVAQLCPNSRVQFVEEGTPRFHDVRSGSHPMVTWASTVLHRMRPANIRYAHRYFVQELVASEGVHGYEAEEAARLAEAEWVLANVNASWGLGWEEALLHQWVPVGPLPQNSKRGLSEVVDGVGVYKITYEPWRYDYYVPGGLQGSPFHKVKQRNGSFVILE